MPANPKISIFTPAHHGTYLREVWNSLTTQNYENFEWVIQPNNMTETQVRAMAGSLPGLQCIRILENIDTTSIGELKRTACDNCRGDIFLELDFDDLLVPNTLPRVARAYRDGAGFIYSDAAVFCPDLTSRSFSAAYGWETYPVTVYGREYTATRCFPLHPRMLCEVYYAPDHLRAWSRETYYQAGGHNPALAVGDDHDLVCRTYMTRAEFRHIGCCGYLYRWHGDNTTISRQKEISAQQNSNRDNYLRPLITEWCRREKRLEIDLGVDQAAGRWSPEDAGLIRSEENGLASHIIARNVLQFIPPAQQVLFFNRACEFIQTGGFLTIDVPSAEGRFGVMHPGHLTQFNLNSFLYYTDREHQYHLKGAEARFQLVVLKEHYPNDSYRQLDMKVIRCDLMKLGDKEDRQPGLKLI